MKLINRGRLKRSLGFITVHNLFVLLLLLLLPALASLCSLQRMNLIIKGDTSGVVEAIKGALQGLPQESVVLRYLLCAAGDITTSDVDLASASGGMVVGFNLNPDEAVLSHAKRLGEGAGLRLRAGRDLCGQGGVGPCRCGRHCFCH